MRALPAIYENGRVYFHFNYPDYEGPVSVLVIFPGAEIWEDLEPDEADRNQTSPLGGRDEVSS